ncbi:adenylyl-sulfate reductase [Thiohalobacter thiocyanaticus]|uniref:Adenylyl-sulfate reductase n=1 Tax=Thiohalobacter thiocyanaticus TaxID=585455 RepID=A0A426QMH6_9GAMM|nr:adenylyl-sulfate reductase [Thiohalobacter thiocyanaticus]RRQ22974.1 adenylyl-sulfate reductase [Thiohalobacter thiocyanaticus]
MQGYVILMVILVVVGTILDMMHKKSAQYFFENAKKSEKNAKRTLGGGEKASLAVQTVASEVLTSSEFKNPRRRASHLLTMWGFVVFVVSTAVLIFGYATQADAGIWPLLWHLGALSLAVGGYWFWFAIRVDLFSEGVKWYNFNGRGDIFIVGLLATSTFALLWSLTMGAGALNTLFFVLFILSATVLFGSVYWSKFAHMFFKPAAAYQKKVIYADGSRENLPDDYDLTDPAVQKRYPDIPEYMGANPPYMGLGINREPPRHY